MKEKLTIKKLGINGEGIGYINKKICFVNGALPDEDVEIEVVERKSKYLKGKLLKVIKPSIYRINVPCKENKECLGCSLLHLKYEQHLISKKKWIEDALTKYTKESIHKIQDVIPATQITHYRNVVRLPITYFNKELHVGIYQRDSHYLTLMEDCMLQNTNINETVKEILKIFNENKLRDFHDKFKTGLRFIEMRCANNEIQVVIICGKDGIPEKVLEQISKIHNVSSVFYSINTAKYQDFKLQGYKKVYGYSQLSYQLNNHNILCSAKSEFPLNFEMEEKKNEVVKKLIKENDKVISLNYGTGSLELNLDNQITAIDSNKDHNYDAKKNKDNLKKENVQFILGDVNKEVIKKCKKNKYDVMILNANEREMSKDIKETLIKSHIKTFIYITPHYSTMAKEIAGLSQYFQLETIIPLDYEPYTSEVLTIVKLNKK
jgi:23S rRNA (uracil-5-)-methyltransferase RumA